MRIPTVLAVAVLALVAAGSLHAASAVTAKDRVLQLSDMPPDAKRISFAKATGGTKIPRTVRGTVAYSAYSFTKGPRTQYVGSATGEIANERAAHQVFLKLRKTAARNGLLKPLKLRKYGDEQAVLGLALSQTAGGVVIVRSGTRIWEVGVSTTPGFAGKTPKLLAELKKYAVKQMRRANRKK